MIELPYPAKILWPNGRAHWAAKHREFQKHKEWAYIAMRVEWHEGRISAAAMQLPVQWSATFYPKTRHPIDDDNARASLKAYQDGFARALEIDDRHFAAPAIHFAEPVKHGRVVIVLS